MPSKTKQELLELKLPDARGQHVRIRELMGEKGLLVVFYRGSFCPYCAGQLASINEYTQRLKEYRINVVAVSADAVSESKALTKQLKLSFPLLSDANKKIIRQFGVLENKKGPSYPPGISKPAVFLLDRNGGLHYSYISQDQIDRPSTKELLEEARKLALDS
jgi:peroxiredoxin